MFLIVAAVIILVAFIALLSVMIVRMIGAPRKLSTIKAMIKQGRIPAATRLVKNLVNSEPRNAAAHYYLALIYIADNKSELALMELKTVNQLGQFGPELPEIDFRMKIAGLYEKFGQAEEALKEYIMLTKLKPNEPDFYLNAGRLFDDRGKAEIAVKYLRRCVELNPRNAEAHYLIGLLLYRAKMPTESKIEFDLALRHDSNLLQAYYYIGRIMKDANDHTGALLAFEKAMRDPEMKMKCLIERGGSYMSLNAIDKAIPELERAVNLIKDESGSESLYARYFLAMCYEKTQSLDRAIEQWEKIYQRKPQFRDVAEKLSQYQEYRTDDRMKDYLTCGKDLFLEICKRVMSQVRNQAPKEINELPGGIEMITLENDSDRWLGTKKQPILARFMRSSDPIDDGSVRNLIDKIKKVNAVKGLIFSSSGFSRSAKEFAEGRSVELIDKEELQACLKKIEFPSHRAKST